MENNNFSYLFQSRLNEVIVYYDYARHEKNFCQNEFKRIDNLKQVKTYSGDITPHAKRRLKRAIECLYMITPQIKIFNRSIGKTTKFRLSHLTLTLSSPQGDYSDKDVNKFLLQPFLRNCKRKLGLKNYVWKAETQVNGNIHYHIISDMYADYDKLRLYWNNVQNTFRYIDEFEARNGHRDPNSTDIHYVRNDSQLAAYLMKYIAKGAKDARKINGKVWDCNTTLKKFKYMATDLSIEEDQEFQEALKKLPHTQYNDQFFSIIKFTNKNYINQLPKSMKDTYIQQFKAVLESNSMNFINERVNGSK